MKACQNCGGTEWVRCEDGTACGNCGLLPYVEPAPVEGRMTLEDAIRAVIGPDAPDDRVLAVALKLAERGQSEPMPAQIEDAAKAAN